MKNARVTSIIDDFQSQPDSEAKQPSGSALEPQAMKNTPMAPKATQAMTVALPFDRGIEIPMVLKDGEPHVAVKPIFVGMGMAWQPQAKKLAERAEEFSCHDIVITGADGKNYTMLCMPLRKINGLLFTINANKVAPEIREKVRLYQEECFKVLNDYWTKGYAVSPYAEHVEPSDSTKRVLKQVDDLFSPFFRITRKGSTPASASTEVNLELRNGIPMVSSLNVAEQFGKQHKNVLRTIEALRDKASVHGLKIEPMQTIVPTHNGGHKEITVYYLDRDAFSLVAMGFTGEGALSWKLTYIAAFNAMEAKLRGSQHISESAANERALNRMENICLEVLEHNRHLTVKVNEFSEKVDGAAASERALKQMEDINVKLLKHNGNLATKVDELSKQVESMGRLDNQVEGLNKAMLKLSEVVAAPPRVQVYEEPAKPEPPKVIDFINYGKKAEKEKPVSKQLLELAEKSRYHPEKNTPMSRERAEFHRRSKRVARDRGFNLAELRRAVYWLTFATINVSAMKLDKINHPNTSPLVRMENLDLFGTAARILREMTEDGVEFVKLFWPCYGSARANEPDALLSAQDVLDVMDGSWIWENGEVRLEEVEFEDVSF